MKSTLKKTISLLLIFVMVMSLFAGCNSSENSNGDAKNNEVISNNTNENSTDESGTDNTEEVEELGTIMWLTFAQSGPVFETMVNYASEVGSQLGYEIKVVYGSAFNDPAENLSAVKNGMTSDVVGIMVSQDGGLKDIMAEYPELFVVGVRADLASAFDEDGPSKEVLSNEKFLGTICEVYADGTQRGINFANAVIEGGYKRVATTIFPPFAYPQAMVSDVAFRQEIEKFNSTASDDDKIELVGDVKVLEFQPLDESFFLEEGNDDLDAIVGILAGLEFVYPALKNSIANGISSPDTKLLTGGFMLEESVLEDVGGDGVVNYLHLAPAENIAWPIIMIDNALSGNMYPDYEGPEQVDSLLYKIDSKEDMTNVIEKSMKGSTEIAKAQLSIDDIKSVLRRFNPEATYADLIELMHSEQLSVESLMD